MWADMMEAILSVVKIEIMHLFSEQTIALSIDGNFSLQQDRDLV